MKYLTTLLSLIITASLFGQINVGPIELVRGTYPGKFEPEDLEKLKATTTLFVCRDSDDPEEILDEFNKVWTITPLEVVTYSEYAKKKNLSNYSVFSMDGYYYTPNTMGANSGWLTFHVYLHLWLGYKNKKGKKDKKSYARIELYPVFAEMRKNYYDKDDLINYLYKEATIKNWGVGYQKSCLKVVNDLIEEKKERLLYGSDYIDDVKKLKQEKLYIPNYIFKNNHKLTGAESSVKSPGKIMEEYPYESEIIESDALNDLILKSEEPVYYLGFVISNTDKYVSVFKTNPDNMLYWRYSAMSNKIKKGDLKLLLKAIDK